MMGEFLGDLLPLSDEKFKKDLLATARYISIRADFLGPSLTSRIILCAPLLNWVPNIKQKVVQLPEGLEPFDEAFAQRLLLDAGDQNEPDRDF